ncbi:MAG: adenylate/guanylate cyclase domain-containing protein [Solirubrobacterales bacterium]|nr:adenylate/guanylate cyclase domain-containing protein [Solirubrobacterales bacterium]
MEVPVEYAKNGDVHIAYRALGQGPFELVIVHGYVTHMGVLWEDPDYRHFCERLASFCRVIRFDKRGMGLSDRVPTGTLEQRMEDVTAVLDAVGSTSSVVMGNSEGGPMAMLFAAAHPERTRALILSGSEVRERKDEDWPWGDATDEEMEEYLARLPERWGRTDLLSVMTPSRSGDEELRGVYLRLESEAASPGAALAYQRIAHDIDARDIVGTIRVPTLVVHTVEDGLVHVENGRFLGREIPGARYVELPGADHVAWGEHRDLILDEIQEFLVGTREPTEPDRVLATVLFTDIVGSTARASQIGDRQWRQRLEMHQQRVRRQLQRFRGREINTTGDGFLAAFDGPARAIRCAKTIMGAEREGGLDIRAGIHTGECEVMGEDLAGVGVHIGARVAALAGAGEVFVSRTVRDLISGSGIELESRGLFPLKGVEGDWEIFAVR